MIPNNNLSPLPFYTDLSKQNHRKDYAFGEIFCLATPDRKILPFQIIRTHRTNAITSALLKNMSGVTILSIITEMNATGLVVNQYTADGYDVIVYPGILPMAITTPEGQYYLQLSDGVETWYSDVFTIIRTLDNFLKIEYYDSESLAFQGGRVDFTNLFKFHIYLNTQLGRPEYPFEEQVENRGGYTFAEIQTSEKTFKFNFVAPEYLLDAMRLIRMMDFVTVTNKADEYSVDTFLITPKWEAGGYLASVEAEFQCDTVIKKTGKGILGYTNGDYNDDLNNDFLNS
ncbi:MAG: hypothetical protein HQ522_07830 [Bacteroidetes bacterium]|nr:hypothetical protein [Bacteroidota bacterium]